MKTFKRCPHCNGSLERPRMTPAQTVAGLKLIQQNKPIIDRWPDTELKRLEDFLESGDELAQVFMCSVVVIRATGEKVEFARRDNLMESLQATTDAIVRRVTRPVAKQQ